MDVNLSSGEICCDFNCPTKSQLRQPRHHRSFPWCHSTPCEALRFSRRHYFLKGIASQSDQKDLTQFLTWMSHSIWMNDDETTRDVRRWIVGKSSQNCQRFEEYGVRISTGHVGGFPYSSMKEILDHPERMKPWKEWDKIHSQMQIFRTVQQQYGQNSHNGWWNIFDSLQFVPTVSEIHTRCKKQEKPQTEKQNNKYKIIPPTPRLEVRTPIAKAIWGTRKFSRSPFWKTTVKLSKRIFGSIPSVQQIILHNTVFTTRFNQLAIQEHYSPKQSRKVGKITLSSKKLCFRSMSTFMSAFKPHQSQQKPYHPSSHTAPFNSQLPCTGQNHKPEQAGFAKVSVNS